MVTFHSTSSDVWRKSLPLDKIPIVIFNFQIWFASRITRGREIDHDLLIDQVVETNRVKRNPPTYHFHSHGIKTSLSFFETHPPSPFPPLGFIICSAYTVPSGNKTRDSTIGYPSIDGSRHRLTDLPFPHTHKHTHTYARTHPSFHPFNAKRIYVDRILSMIRRNLAVLISEINWPRTLLIGRITRAT